MRPSLASMTHSVLEDHRRMDEAIIGLESVVRTEATLARAPRGAVAALVLDLRRRLGRHFAAEEEGGLFEQIERSAPETADACAHLRKQHAAILAALDRRREDLPPACTPRAVLDGWATCVRAILADVKAHEEQEDELLLAALEGGKGAPD